MKYIRAIFVFFLLVTVKVAIRCFYRTEMTWSGETPTAPWRDLRLIVVLNHTSLFEPLYAGIIPLRMLWRVATHGVAPAAAKTIDRPLVGIFYRLIGGRVISVSRKRDASWQAVLDEIDSKSVVLVFPEGRMKRKNGLDRNGKPMTVRGGVSDFLEAIPDGRMLIAYSGGLHHVQCPGQRGPKLFQTLRMKVENLSIAAYRDELIAQAHDDSLKHKVMRDLERRRDIICPPMERLCYEDTLVPTPVEPSNLSTKETA